MTACGLDEPRCRQGMPTPLDELARRQRQPLAADIEPLLALLDQSQRIAQAARQAADGEVRLAQHAVHARHGAFAEIERLGHQVGAYRHGHLGGGAGRRRATVGDEVDQRRVGLVAHRRDQWDGRRRGRPHHDLLVEGPEILQAAAAPRHDQDIGPRHRAVLGQAVEARDGRRHLGCRLLALHRHRPDQHVARKAVGQPVQDVADHRAAGRGHHAHHLGQEGQWPLAVKIEQALDLQPLAPVLQKLEQRAFAGELEAVDDDLVARRAGIGRELAGGDDLHALLDLETEARHRGLPARRRRGRRSRPSGGNSSGPNAGTTAG